MSAQGRANEDVGSGLSQWRHVLKTEPMKTCWDYSTRWLSHIRQGKKSECSIANVVPPELGWSPFTVNKGWHLIASWISWELAVTLKRPQSEGLASSNPTTGWEDCGLPDHVKGQWWMKVTRSEGWMSDSECLSSCSSCCNQTLKRNTLMDKGIVWGSHSKV